MSKILNCHLHSPRHEIVVANINGYVDNHAITAQAQLEEVQKRHASDKLEWEERTLAQVEARHPTEICRWWVRGRYAGWLRGGEGAGLLTNNAQQTCTTRHKPLTVSTYMTKHTCITRQTSDTEEYIQF